MRKILIFVFFNFFSVLWSQSKNDISDFKVKYYMIMASDSTLLKNQSESSLFSYSLLFNSSKSIYYDETAKTFYDYLRNNKGNYAQLSIDSYPKSQSSVYKENDKILVTLPIGNRNLYRYEEPELKWEIMKGKQKKVLSYVCNLAKTTSDTGKVYYAWYTPSIPISEGPFRFKGLNGLVLEVYNEEKTIKINAVEIKKENQLIEALKYVRIYDVSKSQFLKKRKEFILNPDVDNYQSPYKGYDQDGNEIKPERQNSINIKENNLLD